MYGYEPEDVVGKSYTDDVIVQHGTLEPGTPFLQQPFTAEALVRKVEGVLKKRFWFGD